MANNRKIVIKRKKSTKIENINETRSSNFEAHIAYYRANPHRFITEYLDLQLHDFQRLLIYQMNFFPNFIYIASRGNAKSTVALLFAIQRAILYPRQQIVIVTPVKNQAKKFIEKIREFMADSPNLAKEVALDGISLGENNNSVTFSNGSKIFSAVHSENSLGIRCNILIIDEFVRCNEKIIKRVFLPFLTNTRQPRYRDLNEKEKSKLPREPNKQIYLSSIRRAEEWSKK